jgi:hypothetical protein
MSDTVVIPQFANLSREQLHEFLWSSTPSELERLTGARRAVQLYHATKAQVPHPPKGWVRSSAPKVVPPLPAFEPPPEPGPIVQIIACRALRLLSREELFELVWSYPVQQVAKQFGVSDKAVAKRAAVIGVPVPPRGFWTKKHLGKEVDVPTLPPPPKDYAARREKEALALETQHAHEAKRLAFDSLTPSQLTELVTSAPMPAIRDRYGVPPASVARKCREFGIRTPSKGHWSKSKRSLAPLALTSGTIPAECASALSIEPVGEAGFSEEQDTSRKATKSESFKIGTAGDASAMMKTLGESYKEAIEQWLRSDYDVSAHASRKSQLSRGLGALGIENLSGDLSRIFLASVDEIATACADLVGKGHNANSVRTYKSALLAFQAFLFRAPLLAPLTGQGPAGRSADLLRLLDATVHAGSYRPWELARDLAVIKLFVYGGYTVAEITEMTRVGRNLGVGVRPSDAPLVEDYLCALPAYLVGQAIRPLFTTDRGIGIYREHVARSLTSLSSTAGVDRFTLRELGRLHAMEMTKLS